MKYSKRQIVKHIDPWGKKVHVFRQGMTGYQCTTSDLENQYGKGIVKKMVTNLYTDAQILKMVKETSECAEFFEFDSKTEQWNFVPRKGVNPTQHKKYDHTFDSFHYYNPVSSF